jgi:predicted nucleic acid-binding protein
MNIIADTNIFLAVALDETEKANIIEVTGNANIISPEILPYEIGNALSAMIKQKRLTKDEAIKALEIVQNIPVRLRSVDINDSLKIAIEFNIYAYDAYFLSCARSASCPLLTLDKKMKQVARELRIPLLLGE